MQKLLEKFKKAISGNVFGVTKIGPKSGNDHSFKLFYDFEFDIFTHSTKSDTKHLKSYNMYFIITKSHEHYNQFHTSEQQKMRKRH